MEPAELFEICIFHWFRKLAQLSGIDLFADKFKPSVHAYTLILSLFLFAVSCSWTIFSYPFDEKVICFAMLAFSFQGIVKFFSILTNSKSIKDICDFCLKIYKENTKPSPNKTLLAKSVKITVFVFKYGMVLLITTGILVLVKPCISYVASGILDPILPTYFPGINEKEIWGYTILSLYQMYIVFVFVVGTAGCDLSLMALVLNCYTMAHMFHNAVNEFNALIEKYKYDERDSIDEKLRSELRLFLKNLIFMHNDFIKYTRILKETYNEMCLIQIKMANTIMIVLVYVILLLDWFPAYFLMATAFFQVFEYSLMGTIVDYANDKIYSTICNIFITELPIMEQKKIVFMILLAQHPLNLTIGGFQLLNVETFIYSMKNTYSVGMLLVNTQL